LAQIEGVWYHWDDLPEGWHLYQGRIMTFDEIPDGGAHSCLNGRQHDEFDCGCSCDPCNAGLREGRRRAVRPE